MQNTNHVVLQLGQFYQNPRGDFARRHHSSLVRCVTGADMPNSSGSGTSLSYAAVQFVAVVSDRRQPAVHLGSARSVNVRRSRLHRRCRGRESADTSSMPPAKPLGQVFICRRVCRSAIIRARCGVPADVHLMMRSIRSQVSVHSRRRDTVVIPNAGARRAAAGR